jgi:hypothetical protein
VSVDFAHARSGNQRTIYALPDRTRNRFTADEIEAVRRAAKFSIVRARMESGVQISAPGLNWNGAPISGGQGDSAKMREQEACDAAGPDEPVNAHLSPHRG